MAIDLPPAMPPQLAANQEIVRSSERYAVTSGKVGDYELRFSGEHGLSAEDLNSIIDKSQTPSQAILLANAASYKQGQLLVRYYYSTPVNGVITVHAVQQSVGVIKGNDTLRKHFAELEGDRNLTRKEFQTPAVLAGLYADRRGVDYGVSYEENTQINAIDLVFTEREQADADRTTVQAQLGNQGSRFAGRYFFDAGVVHDFDNGTEFAAGYETALTDLGESRDGKDYHRFQLKLDHPFSFGLYGVEASHTQYVRELEDVTVQGTTCLLPLLCVPTTTSSTTDIDHDAEIQQVAFNGSQVLSGDIDHRLMLTQRLEWIDSFIDSSIDTVIQDERYTTAELGASYFRAALVRNKLLNWKVGLAVKGGLGSDKGTLGTDNASSGVSVGKRTAEFVLFKPSAAASYSLSENLRASIKFNAQIADEQLPQQQQWVLGGMDRISAYLPGALVGDSGYHLDAALGYRWLLGDFTLNTEVFAEYGSASYENASGSDSSGRIDYGSDSSLADAGLRLTLSAWDWMEIKAVVAESISADNVNEDILERSEADFFITLKVTL